MGREWETGRARWTRGVKVSLRSRLVAVAGARREGREVAQSGWGRLASYPGSYKQGEACWRSWFSSPGTLFVRAAQVGQAAWPRSPVQVVVRQPEGVSVIWPMRASAARRLRLPKHDLNCCHPPCKGALDRAPFWRGVGVPGVGRLYLTPRSCGSVSLARQAVSACARGNCARSPGVD